MKAPKGIEDARRASESRELALKIRAERNFKIENVLKTKDGRDVLAAILIRTGVDQDVWTGNSEMFKFAGMRSVGLWLRDWIMDANFDSYVTILREMKEDVGTGNTKDR